MVGELHFARLSLYRCGQGQVSRVLRGLPQVHPGGSYPFISFGPFDVVVLSPGAGRGGASDLAPLPGTGERRTLTCWTDRRFRPDVGARCELRLEDLLQYRSQDPEAWNADLLPCWAFVHLRLAPLIQLARPKARSRLEQMQRVARLIGSSTTIDSGLRMAQLRYCSLPLVDGQHLILLVRARDLSIVTDFVAWLRSLRTEARSARAGSVLGWEQQDHQTLGPPFLERTDDLLCTSRWAELAGGTSEHPSAALFEDSASFCAFPVQLPSPQSAESDNELGPAQPIRWVARLRDWSQTPIAGSVTLATTLHYPPSARSAGLATLSEFRSRDADIPFLLGPNQAVVE